MKLKLLFTLLITFVIFSCSNSNDSDSNLGGDGTEPQDPPISQNWEIAQWKNFSESAISHTWDDNTAKQLTVAMPIYDEFDFKTTFFIAELWNPNWTGFKNASNNGHEIASHTLTHTSFDDQTMEEIKMELEDMQNLINEKMGNNNCVTLAYPYCVSENNNLTEDYYIAARTCSGQIVSNSLSDYMNISSFVCGTESGNQTAANFNTIANNAVNQNGWGVYLFHGIDNDGGWSPIESTELREHLTYLNANKDKFWIATFGQVVKYMKERQDATIQQIGETSTKISANLTDDLNNTIYNYPLTIKKEIPQSWANVTVKQNNSTINAVTSTVGTKRYVTFDAIPDVGEIQILKN